MLLARWHRFSMLLTADAEAEAVPIDPGPVDVLKVAHHGSDDAGLDALLDRTSPRLAVISVGADNPYGHPTPETLATLAEHRVPDAAHGRGGDVTIDVTRTGRSRRAQVGRALRADPPVRVACPTSCKATGRTAMKRLAAVAAAIALGIGAGAGIAACGGDEHDDGYHDGPGRRDRDGRRPRRPTTTTSTTSTTIDHHHDDHARRRAAAGNGGTAY